jgi:hypothetical protein
VDSHSAGASDLTCSKRGKGKDGISDNVALRHEVDHHCEDETHQQR